jgi:hypothetical protein
MTAIEQFVAVSQLVAGAPKSVPDPNSGSPTGSVPYLALTEYSSKTELRNAGCG